MKQTQTHTQWEEKIEDHHEREREADMKCGMMFIVDDDDDGGGGCCCCFYI